MSIAVDDLKDLPLFADFSEDVLNELARVANEVVIPAVQDEMIVLDPRRPVTYIYVIIDGNVRATWYPPAQSDLPQLGWSRPLAIGDVPCHNEILLNRPCTTRVTAVANSRLITFDLRTFSQLLTRYPLLYERLLPSKRIRRLRAMPLLMNVPDAMLLWVNHFVSERELAAGETLVGDVEHPTLWMIDSGQLQVLPALAKPKKEILAGPGFYFPDAPLVVGHFRTVYSGEAKVKTRLFGLPMDVVEPLQRYLPVLSHRLYDVGMTLSPPQRSPQVHTIPEAPMLPPATKRAPAAPASFQSVNLPDMIRRASVFANYSDEALQLLTGFFVWQYVPQDLVVVAQGSRDHALRILLEGNALLRSLDALGRARPRSYLSPGNAIGLEQWQGGTSYDVSVEAVMPSTWLTISYQDFEKADLIWQQRHRHHWWQRRAVANKDLWQMLNFPSDFSFLAAHKKKQTTGKKWWHLRYNEKIIWQGRAHIIFLLTKLVDVFLGIAFIFLLIWFMIRISQMSLPSWFWVGLMAMSALLFMILLLATLIDYYNDTSLLTDQRVLGINRTLLKADRRQEIALNRVQDINVAIDFAGQFFDYGTVRIDTAATQGSVLFRNIPHPNIIAGEIRAQKATIRAQQVAARQEAVREELTQRIKRIFLPLAPQQVIPDQWQPSNYYPSRWLQQAWRKTVGVIAWPFRFLSKIGHGFFGFLVKLWRLFLWLPAWLIAVLNGKKPPLLSKQPTIQQTTKKHVSPKPWRIFATEWQEGDTYFWRKTYINLLERAGVWFLVFIIIVSLDVWTRAFILSHKWGLIISAIFTLLSFGKLLWEVDDWGNDRYILTKTEIIDEEKTPLLQNLTRKSASLDKVQNLSSEMGSLWERILRYGTVRIQTAAQEGSITFVKVRRPGEVQQIISKRLDEFRRAQAKREADEQRHIILDGIQVYDEIRFGKEDKPNQP